MTPSDDQTTDDQVGYLHVRVTIDHKYINDMKDIFNDEPFCCYPHKGKKTQKEHIHICFPYDGDDRKKFRDKIVKRLRKRYSLGDNDGRLESRFYENNLSNFIWYAGNEGTEACYTDDRWTRLLEVQMTKEQPFKLDKEVWKQKMLPKQGKKRDLDADWQLTYTNIVAKAINHARAKGLTGGLKEVVQDMCTNTKWRPSYHMVKNGVPDFYHKDYEFRSGKRQKFDMDWMTPSYR